MVEKKGDHSYVVELTPGQRQRAYRGQLQPHVDDVYAGKTFPMHYFTGKAQEVEPVLGEREYIVADGGIGEVKMEGGEPRFSTLWRGYEKPTWEPLKGFVNDELWAFLEIKGLKSDNDPKTPWEAGSKGEGVKSPGGSGRSCLISTSLVMCYWSAA